MTQAAASESHALPRQVRQIFQVIREGEAGPRDCERWSPDEHLRLVEGTTFPHS